MPERMTTSPHPTLHVRRENLRPEVREYVDNLKEQILNILRAYHVATVDEFMALARKKKATEAQTEEVSKLMRALAIAVRSGERPDDEEAREMGRRLFEQAFQDAENIPESTGTKSQAFAALALEQHKSGENPDRAMRAALQHLPEATVRGVLDTAEAALAAGYRTDEILKSAEVVLRKKINQASNEDLNRFAGYLAQNNDIDGTLRFVRWWGSNVVTGAIPATIRPSDLEALMDIAAAMAGRKQDPAPLFSVVEKEIEVHEQGSTKTDMFRLRKALVEVELKAGVDARKAIDRLRSAWGSRDRASHDDWYALYRARSGVLDGETLDRIRIKEQPTLRANILLSFAEYQLSVGERISGTETRAIHAVLSGLGPGTERSHLAERLAALECRAGLPYEESLNLIDDDDDEVVEVGRYARLADVVAAAGGDVRKLLERTDRSLFRIGDWATRWNVLLALAEAAAKHRVNDLAKKIVAEISDTLRDPLLSFSSTPKIDVALRAAAISARIGESPRTLLDYAWEVAETDSAIDGLRTGAARVVKAEAQFGDLDHARELLKEIPNAGVTFGNYFTTLLSVAEVAAAHGESPEDDFDKARDLLTPTNIQVWDTASALVAAEARAGAALIRKTQNTKEQSTNNTR